MNDTMKRLLITIVVFIVVYFLYAILMKYREYDMYINAIQILTSIIGAGCYWIGSNKNN